MLRHLFCVILSGLIFVSTAQENLVPNSGFENYNPRTTAKSFFNEVEAWFSPSDSKTYAPYPTPDHFIATERLYRPGAIKYYTIKSGKAIAGIITYMARLKNYREYIAVKLQRPLTAGKRYEISMYLLTPLSPDFGNIISNGLGAHFSLDSLHQNKGDYLNVKPHFQLETPLEARTWQKVAEQIVVDSAYNFLTIGNFLPNYKTQTIYSQYEVDPQCYFFIDEVVVKEVISPIDTNRVLEKPKVSLEKSKPPAKNTELPVSIKGRFVYQQNRLKTRHRKIVVKIWDGKEVDGDIISLKFNDEWVLEKYLLTKAKKRLTLNLEAGRQNFLIMFAENLGRKPPNTASFMIKTDEKRRIFRVRSDFRRCGAVRLDYAGD